MMRDVSETVDDYEWCVMGKLPVARHGSELLHDQVAERLRQMADDLAEGDRIPTEPELMELFGVSRSTVRRAVDLLVSDGLLARQPPKGTFVTRPPIQHSLDHPGAFLDTLVAGGSQVTPSLVSFRWTASPEPLPAGLGNAALYFERFYAHGDQPCAFARIYIPEPFAGRISRGDLEDQPSYEVFVTKLGVRVDHTDVTIRAAHADGELAERLRVDERAPVIVLHRWMYASESRVLQYSTHYLPAHQFELSLTHAGAGHRAGADARPPAVLRLVSSSDEESHASRKRSA